MGRLRKPEHVLCSKDTPMPSSQSFLPTPTRYLQSTKVLFHANTDEVTPGPREESWGSSTYPSGTTNPKPL